MLSKLRFKNIYEENYIVQNESGNWNKTPRSPEPSISSSADEKRKN
jgi:hypothetical protein